MCLQIAVQERNSTVNLHLTDLNLYLNLLIYYSRSVSVTIRLDDFVDFVVQGQVLTANKSRILKVSSQPGIIPFKLIIIGFIFELILLVVQEFHPRMHKS